MGEPTTENVRPVGGEPPGGPAPDRFRSVEHGFERGLDVSRLLVLLPVAVLALAALAAFLYGAGLFVWAIVQVTPHPFPVRGHSVGMLLLVIDLFLVGATLLVSAIGFYELFLSRIDAPGVRGLPGWLLMRDLNDLKARVIAMLVLVAAVSFVDVVVEYAGGHDVLYLGGGIALVIIALTTFLRYGNSD